MAPIWKMVSSGQVFLSLSSFSIVRLRSGCRACSFLAFWASTKRPYDPLNPVVCIDETNKQLIQETWAPVNWGSWRK